MTTPRDLATEATKRGFTIHSITVGADADRDLMKAIAFAGKGRGDALMASNVLVSQMPRCARAFSLRASCYSHFDVVELAKADRIAAVELAPLNGEYHCSLGEVLFDAGVAIAKELKYSAKSCDLEIAACKKEID